MNGSVKAVAVVGTGLIGASWAAQFLAQGLDVIATDIAPGAQGRLEAQVAAAWPALEEIGLAEGASLARLRFTSDLAEAVGTADFVQENGPERLELKRDLFAELDRLARPQTILATSSSGLMMSQIQSACALHPERCLVAHPFNPPHLIPLVELVGGESTSPETIAAAEAFYRGIGKRTIRVNREMQGHVANRLQLALLREAIHLVAEGVVSVADVDAAVSWGPGLRWGIMGQVMLYHLGGGEGGLEAFFAQFAKGMNMAFGSLGQPELTDDLAARLVAGVKEEAGARSIEELAAYRNKVLIGLLELRKDEP